MDYAFGGSMPTGLPIMRIDGNEVRVGAATWGSAIAVLKGPQVFHSDRNPSTPIRTVRDSEVFKGSLTVGRPIATYRDGDVMAGAVAAAYLLILQPYRTQITVERGGKASRNAPPPQVETILLQRYDPSSGWSYNSAYV